MTAEQIAEVERIVNAQILKNTPVQTRVLPIEEAKKTGAVMLFGERYGEVVRVLDIGKSTEFCGGTHVKATGDIGFFKVVSESGIAAGVRRIEATCGKLSLQGMERSQGVLHKAAQFLKTAPAGLLERMEQMPQVDSDMGLANIEAMDGYVLTDSLTARQFAELTDMDIEVVQLAYAAYAADQEDYGQIVGSITSSTVSNYAVPLIDMFTFIYDEKEAGYVNLDDDLNEKIDDLHDQLDKAKKQLSTEDYSRMLLYTNVPEEGPETFEFLDELHKIVQEYYPEGSYVVGDSTSDYDLSNVFSTDNLMVSILSFLFVLVILVFTFKSAGLPVLLLAIIQGSVWINFSVPVLTDTNIFFLSYLIVSSIQMGANIDYAIVISSRYTELKKSMSIKDAMVETLNQAFPTIITSGAILAIAGLLIGFLSSDVAISSVGICLGRGTLLSIGLVMFVLPQILLLGDAIIEKTSFTLKRRDLIQKRSGYMRVNGRVRGYVCGIVDANISGMIHGEISAQLDSDAAETMKEKVDRQIINHIDMDGKRIEDIESAAPTGQTPDNSGTTSPHELDTADDVDDIMDETED